MSLLHALVNGLLIVPSHAGECDDCDSKQDVVDGGKDGRDVKLSACTEVSARFGCGAAKENGGKACKPMLGR